MSRTLVFSRGGLGLGRALLRSLFVIALLVATSACTSMFGNFEDATGSGGQGTTSNSTSSSTITTNSTSSKTGAYSLGGTVTGFAVGGSLVLENNGGDDLTITSDGAFTFAAGLENGASYDVTVTMQPMSPAETCVVTAGKGTVSSGDVTSVVVTCTTHTHTVGGTLSGLDAGDSLTLRDDGGDDLTLTADGTFQFQTPVASGQTYNVSVVGSPMAPIEQTCVVTAGTGAGTILDPDVTSVLVTCTTSARKVGGTLTGLAPGETVVLSDDGGDLLTLGTNGPFTFATSVPSGEMYDVAVVTSPTSPIAQACVITTGTGTGTLTDIDVTSVGVTCSTSAFTIGGMLSGLATGDGVLLRDDGGDDLVVSANGTFTFATSVPSGQTFDVTRLQQPDRAHLPGLRSDPGHRLRRGRERSRDLGRRDVLHQLVHGRRYGLRAHRREQLGPPRRQRRQHDHRDQRDIRVSNASAERGALLRDGPDPARCAGRELHGQRRQRDDRGEHRHQRHGGLRGSRRVRRQGRGLRVSACRGALRRGRKLRRNQSKLPA